MSAQVTVRWDKRALTQVGLRNLEPQLMRMGQVLRSEVVKAISIPTSTHGPSKPGNPIHADTGRARQSVFMRKDPGPSHNGVPTSVVKVGTNLNYAIFWEFNGRSFLRSTLAKQLPRLRQMIRGGTVRKG